MRPIHCASRRARLPSTGTRWPPLPARAPRSSGRVPTRAWPPRWARGPAGTGFARPPPMAAGYAPRTADATVLHRVVREHLDAFLAAAAARTDGAGVPPFIEREFREFLGCGVYSRGFARV